MARKPRKEIGSNIPKSESSYVCLRISLMRMLEENSEDSVGREYSVASDIRKRDTYSVWSARGKDTLANDRLRHDARGSNACQGPWSYAHSSTT